MGQLALDLPVKGVSQGGVAFPSIEKVRGRVLNEEIYFERLLTGRKKYEASPTFTHDEDFTHILFHPNKKLRDQGYNINVLAQCKPALFSKKFSLEEVTVLTGKGKHLGMNSEKHLKRYARGRKLALFPVSKAVDTTGIMAWNDCLGKTANQQGFSRARLPTGHMLFDYLEPQCQGASCLSLTAVTGDDIHESFSPRNQQMRSDACRTATSSDFIMHLRKRYVYLFVLFL